MFLTMGTYVMTGSHATRCRCNHVDVAATPEVLAVTPLDKDVVISICCLLADFLQHGHQAKHRVNPFLNDLKIYIYEIKFHQMMSINM